MLDEGTRVEGARRGKIEAVEGRDAAKHDCAQFRVEAQLHHNLRGPREDEVGGEEIRDKMR